MSVTHLILLYVLSLVAAWFVAHLRLRQATAGRRFPGLHYAKYVLGAFLGVTIALIFWVLANAADCSQGDRYEKTGLLKLGDACGKGIRSWYAVLTDWQSGIGAFIGLLGLAWSTILKALMEKAGASAQVPETAKGN